MTPMLKAQIYIDQDELFQDKPLYEFILKLLITHNISGATVFRGRFGYGEGQHLNRPNDLFSFDETPFMISLIDDDEKVKQALTALRQVYKGGFIITHAVEKW